MADVVMVIAAEGFRDEELFETLDELENAGHRVTVASASPGTCHGMLGGHAEATVGLDQVRPEDIDAIVFVGGSGAERYFDDARALWLASEMALRGKITAAICIAPIILANAGLLKGRRATVFESEVATLKRKGARYTSADVTIDDRIITADGPRSARAFGRAVARALVSQPA